MINTEERRCHIEFSDEEYQCLKNAVKILAQIEDLAEERNYSTIVCGDKYHFSLKGLKETIDMVQYFNDVTRLEP